MRKKLYSTLQDHTRAHKRDIEEGKTREWGKRFKKKKKPLFWATSQLPQIPQAVETTFEGPVILKDCLNSVYYLLLSLLFFMFIYYYFFFSKAFVSPLPP